MHPNDYNAAKTASGGTSRLLTADQLATICGISVSTLNKLRVRGGGPAYYKVGRRVLYDPDDYARWLKTHRRTSTSEAA